MSSPGDDEDRMRADWREFVDYFRLFETFEPIRFLADEPFVPSPSFRETFPLLSDLLRRARSFAIETEFDDADARKRMVLRSWTSAEGETFGWLCFAASASRSRKQPLADHRTLLREFGGIREWCRPKGDLCPNLIEALRQTEEIDQSCRKLYREVLAILEAPPAIDLSKWRFLAHHGNGDAFIVQPRTGEVLYLGYDVDLKRAVSLDGRDTPVYRLDGIPDFRAWVETIAQQHLEALGPQESL